MHKSRTIPKMRVEISQIQDNLLLCSQEDDVNSDAELLKVRVNVAQTNDLFRQSVSHFWVGAQLNLLQVNLNSEGYYTPQYIILEPDYLVDVTSVAECFTNYATTPLLYLLNRFFPKTQSKPILLGNLANLMIDRMMHRTEVPQSFMDMLKQSFRETPLAYATCEDIAEQTKMQEFVKEAQQHFQNIEQTIQQQFPGQGIYAGTVILEPAFLCETYGLQGRLDLFQPHDVANPARIVELKSGSFFPSDSLPLPQNNFAQATLYRLMIQSAFALQPEQVQPSILYSKLALESLKYAPYLQTWEKKVLDMRNQIVAVEYELARDKSGKYLNTYLETLLPERHPAAPPFFTNKLRNLHEPIRKATPTERCYFNAFVRFIAEEHLITKIGNAGHEVSSGQAALWANEFEVKQEAYEILYNLTILNNQIHTPERTIVFQRDPQIGGFVNFRTGDLCVLYPRKPNDSQATICNNQTLKGTILKLTKEEVTVKFRYQQRNPHFLTQHTHWALEHDTLDSNFATQYQSLFAFLKAQPDRRSLLLGLRPPETRTAFTYQNPDLRPEQVQLVRDALAANDYYLLVGPPGTGKTSRVLRAMVQKLYENPSANVLLLAYTNRAVDEICMAIRELPFTRIGTTAHPDFRGNLLENQIAQATTRQQVLNILEGHRIFVSTMASLASRPELFKLKQFDVAIVDEASQILEPQLIGLLARPEVKKFILIGDDKQLPAIVQQSDKRAETDIAELNAIGLHTLKNSLFERLLARTDAQGWTWARGTLTFQGRMHEQIASFANTYFYDNQLNTIRPEQQAPLVSRYLRFDQTQPLERLLASRRVIFFPSMPDHTDKPTRARSHTGPKSHLYEAKLVVQLIRTVQRLYQANKQPFDPALSLGVITPYRNQIALIRHLLDQAQISDHDKIMIDTVERFQGSERDVIIYSFSVNTPRQVLQLPNLTSDGRVDRKLNVALTRAREQFIGIGNPDLLSANSLFSQVISWARQEGGYIQESIQMVLDNSVSIPDKVSVTDIPPVSETPLPF
ncbi:ATP-dependent helicase [Rudanella lutea]|uniref:ATP-dependent helicase n=1 Tax=Rudanella lutea TaxID=451374 RepID=UPI001B7FDE32|nr:AAA domain-containing protein [Rudanella lutea]